MINDLNHLAFFQVCILDHRHSFREAVSQKEKCLTEQQLLQLKCTSPASGGRLKKRPRPGVNYRCGQMTGHNMH